MVTELIDFFLGAHSYFIQEDKPAGKNTMANTNQV